MSATQPGCCGSIPLGSFDPDHPQLGLRVTERSEEPKSGLGVCKWQGHNAAALLHCELVPEVQMARQLKFSLFAGTVCVLLTLSAGVNVLQARRIRSLLDATQASPVLGTRAPVLTGYSVLGTQVEVRLDTGLPTFVYYFSPSCGWCERNWANIQALAFAGKDKFRVVAVTTERNLRDYLYQRQVTVDVIEGISENTRARFGFRPTPHTVVVSGDGVITRDWQGAFTPRIERQIEELFVVDLPGLSPAPGKSVPLTKP